MKKIYSIVLMATALLIGTNAWAKPFSGTTHAQLQKAIADIIYGVESDSEIKLQNDVDLTETLWVGTEKLSDPYKSITIDLNGNNITLQGTNAHSKSVIALTHGELKIINTAANEANVQLTGSAGANAIIVAVYGSYRSSRWNEEGTALEGEGTNTRVQGWCSHLEIGSNVKLYAEQGCQGTGLYIGNASLKYPKADGSLASTAYNVIPMKTSNWGFAHGVRVDFYGKIDFQGTNSGKGYGIKANGTMRSPLSCVNNESEGFKDAYTNDTKSTYVAYLANYYNHNAAINENATLATDATHKRDTVDAPFIWIHPGAEITTRDAGDKVTALYAAGYAKWLVQGYAAGKTGMYVSSGVLDLNDAYVKSTAAAWESSTSAGSANGGGSGVVLNSRSNYAGGVDFTVSGDTHIESIKGYAIEEIVNTTPVANPKADPSNPEFDPQAPDSIQVTKVANITIEGGTISGGTEGAIVVSTVTLKEAAESDDVEVVVYGGNVIGESYAGDKDAITTGDLSDLMPSTGYHTTEVKDGNGNTVLVISEGDAPSAPVGGNMVSNQSTDASIKWTVNTKDTIKTYLKLTELEINTTGLAQELVIKENATLEVKRVVLGKDAKIVVEAGAKFIVTGEQGIVAPVAENIVLKTSETAQATFLFNPDVRSNRHPMATVELKSKAYTKSNGTHVWQRFGVPSYADTVQRKNVLYDKVAAPTAFRKFDYVQDFWVNMAATDAFVPFQCYELNTSAATAGALYTFKCPLMGNDNGELKMGDNWNYYANSYTAPIDIREIVSYIVDDFTGQVSGTVYLYRASDNWWYDINLASIDDGDVPLEIDPMQAFILQRQSAGQNPSINYKDHIWTPLTGSGNLAPTRRRNTLNKAVIEITADNGAKDYVRLVEGNQFSDEFDNGYDASKFMNNESFQLFANAGEEHMSTLATDNLEGTTLSLTTKSQTSFTMTFRNVNGLGYAIRDMLTGTEVEIVEGATYMFSVPANASVAGRFQVVEPKKLPTAIEDVEENAAVKGIYTLTGQYVGNDYHNLPAGVYVVNGKKIVK